MLINRVHVAVVFTSVVVVQAALAQTNATFLLMPNNTVSPTSPTTTIGIWATWVDPAAEFAFIGGNYDLTAGEGVFSNPVNVLRGPGSGTGLITGNTVSGAVNSQPSNPMFPKLWVRDNPILLATYDWTTTNFTPRTVDLHTSNTFNFVVALFTTGASTQLYPQEFTPGSGFIQVVPAPATWMVLVLPLSAISRRKR